jgi:hypothetical protein
MYINPVKGTKEQWLGKLMHCSVLGWEDTCPVIKQVRQAEFLAHSPGSENRYGLCHVNNGWMTALGVAFNEREALTFCSPDDSRPKRFYLAHKLCLTDEAGLEPEDIELLK